MHEGAGFPHSYNRVAQSPTDAEVRTGPAVTTHHVMTTSGDHECRAGGCLPLQLVRQPGDQLGLQPVRATADAAEFHLKTLNCEVLERPAGGMSTCVAASLPALRVVA